MTAIEARQIALDKQKHRWAKLPPDVRSAIQDATAIGELRCIVTKADRIDFFALSKLGYNAREIFEDIIEISW